MNKELIEVKPRKKREICMFTVMIEDSGEVYRISKHKLWRFLKNLDKKEYRYKVMYNSEDPEGDVLLSDDL
jgi:hypothetical protein